MYFNIFLNWFLIFLNWFSNWHTKTLIATSYNYLCNWYSLLKHRQSTTNRSLRTVWSKTVLWSEYISFLTELEPEVVFVKKPLSVAISEGGVASFCARVRSRNQKDVKVVWEIGNTVIEDSTEKYKVSFMFFLSSFVPSIISNKQKSYYLRNKSYF